MSSRIKQLLISLETKSLDNVIVDVVVAVQYKVEASDDDAIAAAYYTLTNADTQIQSYVSSAVRSCVPSMNIDDVFASKREIADSVQQTLEFTLKTYGFVLVQTLVVDIKPNNYIKASMNEINANKRLKIAAEDKAEAQKVQIVKGAEAEAESSYLQGVGTARQRAAIVAGLKESVQDFKDINAFSSKDVMDLILVSQYFDTLRDISSNDGTKTVLLNDDPCKGSIADAVCYGVLQAELGQKTMA